MGESLLLGYVGLGAFFAWAIKRVYEAERDERWPWWAWWTVCLGWGIIIPLAVLVYPSRRRIQRHVEEASQATQEHPAFAKRRAALAREGEKETES